MTTTPPRRSRLAVAALATVVLVPTLGAVAAPSAVAAPELTRNGSFELGTDGWRTNTADTSVTSADGGADGSHHVVLGSRDTTTVVLNDRDNTVPVAGAGDTYTVAAWVRTDVPQASGQLRVREVGVGAGTAHTQGFFLDGTDWTRVELDLEVATEGAALDLNVLAWNNPAERHVEVDGVTMTLVAEAPEPAPEPEPEVVPEPTADPDARVAGRLQNGCSYTVRGIPSCGAYFGGAIGGNSDPAAFESQMGHTLGVRRTFFQSYQVGNAVETARRDLAAGRLPWISFKLPHSWAEMSAGRGDAWVRDLTARFDALDGPVWLAFHHEPENDSTPIQQWTEMQEHLGPIVRQGADNVGFSVIVMGWHQLYGASHLRFEAMWPDTKIDVAGFDVYNFQGMPSGTGIRTEPLSLDDRYFQAFRAWSERTDTPWGLAETGYTNYTAEQKPRWIRRTFNQLRKAGGIAFSYFNSSLNSKADWTLSTPGKELDYQVALKRSARLPGGSS